MVNLNKPSAGDTDWTGEINDNWTALQNQLVNAFQGRLQRDSATQVSLQRYGGDTVEVNGSNVSLGTSGLTRARADNLITSSGGDAGAGGMSADTLYYVYVSNSSASPFPSELRASATAPTLFNGINYLGTSGNEANWRFVGWVRTTSGNSFADSETQRLVVNYYNRRKAHLFSCPGYVDDNSPTTYATTSTTWTPANGGSGSKLEFIANGEDSVIYGASSVSVNSALAQEQATGVGEDSTTVATIGSETNPPAAAYRMAQSCGRTYRPPEGYRHLNLLIAVSAGTGTWSADRGRPYGSSGPDTMMTNIWSEIMG